MAREGLDRAATRRIADEAGAPQGIFHYVFRGKTELLEAVIGTVTQQVEQVLRDTVDPCKGLAAAISDAVQAFWQHVLADDGLQLMQYELTIYCRRTPGLEWLADYQYARYIAATTEVLSAAAEHDTAPSAISLDQLTRFFGDGAGPLLLFVGVLWFSVGAAVGRRRAGSARRAAGASAARAVRAGSPTPPPALPSSWSGPGHRVRPSL
jgi:AcrR family transcriptional regulator